MCYNQTETRKIKYENHEKDEPSQNTRMTDTMTRLEHTKTPEGRKTLWETIFKTCHT
jgi:hypothetical protein